MNPFKVGDLVYYICHKGLKNKCEEQPFVNCKCLARSKFKNGYEVIETSLNHIKVLSHDSPYLYRDGIDCFVLAKKPDVFGYHKGLDHV